MTTSTHSSQATTSVSTGRSVLLVAGAAVAAAVVNVVVSLLAQALGASAAFGPFQPPVLVTFTLVGVAAGAAGWAVVRRTAKDPAARLRVLVPVVVGLSLLPDLALLAVPMPGASVLAVVSLMFMHVLVAVVAVPAFRRAMPLRAHA